MDLIIKAIEAKLQSAGLNWIKLQSLQLRIKDRSLTAEVLLDGEPLPLAVEARYEIVGDKIKIASLNTSKKWLTEAANLALLKTDGAFPLPGGIGGKLLKFFL